MTKILCAALVASGLALTVGCGSEGKKADPKVADPSKVDPRLKPSESGAGGVPQGNKANQAVKGD